MNIFMPCTHVTSEASFKSLAVFFMFLLLSPLQTAAMPVFTTAACLFQKHNIAIICQLIPPLNIINSLRHTHTDTSTVILAV